MPSRETGAGGAADLDDIVLVSRATRTDLDEDEDLLALLLHARDEETDGGGWTTARSRRGDALPWQVTRPRPWALWTWYLLDQHRDIADRIRGEILGTLGDRDPTVEDIPNLGAATRAIEEAMRIYPPAWIITRIAKEADEIGGYRVKPGTLVTLSPYLTQRARRSGRPERFDPDRFTPSVGGAAPASAYSRSPAATAVHRQRFRHDGGDARARDRHAALPTRARAGTQGRRATADHAPTARRPAHDPARGVRAGRRAVRASGLRLGPESDAGRGSAHRCRETGQLQMPRLNDPS